MWLEKLFGGQKRQPEIDLDEEPARFSAPPDVVTKFGTRTSATQRTEVNARGPQTTKSPPGFDPYNSGTFNKKDDAWERVIRR